MSLLVSGAKVAVLVNGHRWGKVTSFQYNITTGERDVYGIDSILPYELAPTFVNISGTLTVYRATGDGGAEGVGMATPIYEFPRGAYFSLALVDIVRDIVLFEAQRCQVVSQSWTSSSRNLMIGNISFKALDYNNEVRPT